MNWIELANPSRLAWGLLAIPVIVMFILRNRLRRRTVSTLMFWDQLLEDQPPRVWWRRLRNLVSLLCQLAFIALLVGAIADPLWSWQRRAARRVVYVLDNSSSMSARERPSSVSRIERARAAARQMIRSLRGRDTAAIVTAGGLPRVLLGATGDRRLLRSSVERVEATDAPTRLAEAVETARRLIAGDERGEVVVLTDGGSKEITSLRASDDVTVYGFGEASPNLPITSFQVRRSVADAIGFQVLVEVTNFGDESADCRLELDLEGNVVDVIPLSIEPDDSWRRTLEHTSTEGGRLTAQLDASDDRAAGTARPNRRDRLRRASELDQRTSQRLGQGFRHGSYCDDRSRGRNQFNLQQTDAAFESLASSIDSAAALQQAAADLKAEQYDEAAEKLEQFDLESMSNKKRRAVANSLKNLAKGNLGELSESAAEMAEGLEKENGSQCKSGACKLARLARKQCLRKSICKCLGNQLNQLSMCKSQCNSNGCQSNSKSETPSNTWGLGSRDPLGRRQTVRDYFESIRPDQPETN